MSDEVHFNDEDDAKAEIQAAVRCIFHTFQVTGSAWMSVCRMSQSGVRLLFHPPSFPMSLELRERRSSAQRLKCMDTTFRPLS